MIGRGEQTAAEAVRLMPFALSIRLAAGALATESRLEEPVVTVASFVADGEGKCVLERRAGHILRIAFADGRHRGSSPALLYFADGGFVPARGAEKWMRNGAAPHGGNGPVRFQPQRPIRYFVSESKSL